MPTFLDGHTYSHTGSILARLVGFERFISEHPDITKHLLIIESEPERRDILKIISSVLSDTLPVQQIECIQDILRFRVAISGIFIASPGILDASLRLEYLQTKLSFEISLAQPTAPRDLTEKLLELGFVHSPSLAKPMSYHLSGSEYQIRDGTNEYRISYFGEELDDIISVSGGLNPAIERRTHVTLYQVEPEGLPISLKKITSTPYPGMVWTFDLDFLPERAEIRALFAHSVGFE